MRTHSIRDLTISAAFGAFLVLPALDTWFGLDPTPDLAEKRTLAPYPDLAETAWADSAARFQAAYDDRFGFRRLLVRSDAWLKLRVFGDSPAPDRVLVGRDGWLFLAGDGVATDHAGETRVDEADLRTWRRGLAARRAWFEAHGIVYDFAVAPDKASLYPEHLPPSFTPGPTRFDALRPVFEAEGFPVGTLRDALVAAKPHGLLYFATDTHWTSLGAWIAYHAWFERLRQQRVPTLDPPLERNRFRSATSRRSMDLANLAGLNDWLTEEDHALVLDLDPSVLRVESARCKGIEDPLVVVHNRTKELRCVLLRDSFGDALVTILPQHFGTTVFASSSSNRFEVVERLVREYGPDLVLELRVERRLRHPPALDDALRTALEKAR